VTSLDARKRAGLKQKLDALDAEFQEWLKLTEAKGEFEKHHTQVRALAGHLSGLRAKTLDRFKEAEESGILCDARNLESLLLGIRRIWEFFRSKLMQRGDPQMRMFLQLADELAWSCYRPVLDVAGPKARREPPLVFLNGGLSPYTLSRDEAFQAEPVPGEALSGGAWDKVLQHLPIPVIGIPWYQTVHLPDLPVVAHETGHAVEQDFGLGDILLSNIGRQLQGTPGTERLAHWKAWSNEIFADVWGCLTAGPAFVSSLMDFLALSPELVENEIATEQGKYPTAQLRIQICLTALHRLGFGKEIPKLREPWSGEFKNSAMAVFAGDVPAIVGAILDSGYPIGEKTWLLSAIPDLQFTQQYWGYAQTAASEQRGGYSPDSATTASILVAASRFAFDEDPAAYLAEKRGVMFQKHIQAIVVPGVRAGQAELSDEEKEELSRNSHARGEAWFEDFAAWTGARQR
jgi:hypothetical protein